MTQNPFFCGKYFRTISLNSNYICIFKAPRDSSQIQYLARQIYPNNPKFIQKAYELVTKNAAHSYLWLDLTQQMPDIARVWTDITSSAPMLLLPDGKAP